MLNDKRGPIGRSLRGIRREHRELWFIFGQLSTCHLFYALTSIDSGSVYSIIFMIPPATLFIHSAVATNVFLVTIFVVSAWNGASFYVEVFGRKFERELERLRKEMELASATGTSVTTPSAPSSPWVDPISPASTIGGDDQRDNLNNSPLLLPEREERAMDMEVPEMMLDRAAEEIDYGEKEVDGNVKGKSKTS
jgi:hypothetical protein